MNSHGRAALLRGATSAMLGVALILVAPALGPAAASYAAPPTAFPYAVAAALSTDAAPPADATLTIAPIGVDAVPVWTGRPYRLHDPDPAFRYAIAPGYGVTRFAGSAAFGRPGLTIVFGQDNIMGSVFRYLRNVRAGDRVTVRRARHIYSYTVRSITITTPLRAGQMLDRTYRRHTLALVSCTPYWVDTQRIVVIANG